LLIRILGDGAQLLPVERAGLLPVMCAGSQCAVDRRNGCLANSRGAASIPVVPSGGCPEYVVAGGPLMIVRVAHFG